MLLKEAQNEAGYDGGHRLGQVVRSTMDEMKLSTSRNSAEAVLQQLTALKSGCTIFSSVEHQDRCFDVFQQGIGNWLAVDEGIE